MTTEAKKQPERILRISEVLARTGLTQTSMYRLAQDGHFPRPLKIGPKASGWLESEISEWIRQKVAERDARREATA